jgi:hypothetical protein
VRAVGLPQQFDSVPVKRLPRRGGRYTLHSPLEQLHAQIALQITHLLADRGLHDVQRLTRSRGVAALHHLHEITQLPNVHAGSLFLLFHNKTRSS